MQEAEDRRKEERTGRIRAEVRLRQVTKQLQQLEAVQKHGNGTNSSGDGKNKNNSNSTSMLLESIGSVTSPYTKRMGTPRQPQLVPSSRGFIEFTVPAAALDGMDAYSHVWIIFEFHANTNVDKAKTKIRPPRAGGLKVGQLATRSPHRPNCLGLSLVQVEAWDAKTRRLHIRGLDLVHGTPVYDVKPCVPWDVPATDLRVPSWVETDDSLAQVTFLPAAQDSLRQHVQSGRLAPLYTAHQSDGVAAAQQTLKEILAQDPRSSHKGLKTNARGTIANSNDDSNNSSQAYNLVFGHCQVFFRVLPDQVVVERIDAIDFESATYADGVPLIMANEKKN